MTQREAPNREEIYTGCQILETRSWIPDPRFQILAFRIWLPYPGGGQWTSNHQHVLQDDWMVAPLHHRLDSVPAFLHTLCIHGVQRVRSSSTKRECGVRTECAFLIEPISGNSDGRLSTTHCIADDT